MKSGARLVVLTVPPKERIEATVVMGVNDHILRPDHTLISNSSCTTNCAAPVAKVLQERWGIEKGYLSTVHAFTNDQRLFDYPHKDFRRARMATLSIIPTSTGAAQALGWVIPELDGKIEGIAYRVPVPTGSLIDFTVMLERKATAEEINAAMKEAWRRPPEGNRRVYRGPHRLGGPGGDLRAPIPRRPAGAAGLQSAILLCSLFFLAALVLTLFVREHRGRAAAVAYTPDR